MGLGNIVRSKGFKNFMAKLYGFGAAIVILGALFKINHYDYANEMLIIGMGLESLIFFFSAFETPPVDPDWSLVYPELTHLYHNGESPVRNAVNASRPVAQSGTTQQLDKLLADAKIGPELIQSLGDGLRKFSENAAKLSGLSTALVATEDFAGNLQKASSSVERLAVSSKKTSDILDRDSQATEDYVNNVRNASQKVAELSTVYSQASISLKSDLQATGQLAGAVKLATQSANELAQKYAQSAESVSRTFDTLSQSKLDSDAYNTQLKKIASNLSALNTVYELQLQTIHQQVESGKQIQNAVGSFVSNIEQSSGNMTRYKEEVDLLTRKIAALSSVYGNMLAAMNVPQK